MFIYNLKVNKKFFSKVLIALISVFCCILLAISTCKILNEVKNENKNPKTKRYR